MCVYVCVRACVCENGFIYKFAVFNTELIWKLFFLLAWLSFLFRFYLFSFFSFSVLLVPLFWRFHSDLRKRTINTGISFLMPLKFNQVLFFLFSLWMNEAFWWRPDSPTRALYRSTLDIKANTRNANWIDEVWEWQTKLNIYNWSRHVLNINKIFIFISRRNVWHHQHHRHHRVQYVQSIALACKAVPRSPEQALYWWANVGQGWLAGDW